MTGSNNPRPYVVSLRCNGIAREFKVTAYDLNEAIMQAGFQACGEGADVSAVLSIQPDAEAIVNRDETIRRAIAMDVRSAITMALGNHGRAQL